MRKEPVPDKTLTTSIEQQIEDALKSLRESRHHVEIGFALALETKDLVTARSLLVKEIAAEQRLIKLAELFNNMAKNNAARVQLAKIKNLSGHQIEHCEFRVNAFQQAERYCRNILVDSRFRKLRLMLFESEIETWTNNRLHQKFTEIEHRLHQIKAEAIDGTTNTSVAEKLQIQETYLEMLLLAMKRQ